MHFEILNLTSWFIFEPDTRWCAKGDQVREKFGSSNHYFNELQYYTKISNISQVADPKKISEHVINGTFRSLQFGSREICDFWHSENHRFANYTYK